MKDVTFADIDKVLQERVAREIEEIIGVLDPLLKKRSHLASAFALATMAAHHVLDDEAEKEDFLALVQVCWERARVAHQKTCTP